MNSSETAGANHLAAIAREVKVAQDQARQIDPISARPGGLDLPGAYEIARIVHQARLAEGRVARGRKIGFTNADLWPVYGVREPIWGPMYDNTVMELANGLGTCRIGRFTEPRIEPEIAFHFSKMPPRGADLPGLLDCIDWVAHGFEIVQSRYPGWKFQAADTIADGALHAALLLGPRQAVDQLGAGLIEALKAFSITLLCDGQPVETGSGAKVLGHPLAAVAHLIEVLASQPKHPPLQAGEIVTTGTLTQARVVRAGEVWSTTLQGIALPGLAVVFTE
jgi:2-keto-4-pentenoate hydratase